MATSDNLSVSTMRSLTGSDGRYVRKLHPSTGMSKCENLCIDPAVAGLKLETATLQSRPRAEAKVSTPEVDADASGYENLCIDPRVAHLKGEVATLRSRTGMATAAPPDVKAEADEMFANRVIPASLLTSTEITDEERKQLATMRQNLLKLSPTASDYLGQASTTMAAAILLLGPRYQRLRDNSAEYQTAGHMIHGRGWQTTDIVQAEARVTRPSTVAKSLLDLEQQYPVLGRGSCAVCGKAMPPKMCPCGQVAYCDGTCQRIDWSRHRSSHNKA